MTTSQMLSQLSIDELRERIIRLSMQAIHTNSEADREAARTYQQEWSRRYARRVPILEPTVLESMRGGEVQS
jgi:hypothetical protein